MDTIATRLESVKLRIAEAAKLAGRDPQEILLLAASKKQINRISSVKHGMLVRKCLEKIIYKKD